MRALLTAAIAAIEAVAVALAVLAFLAVPAVLMWWLAFDLEAEPLELATLVAALWQLAHLVPMTIGLSAQTALSLGLSPEALTFTFSLAPLGLTLITASLAWWAGHRAGVRGARGAWAIVGGVAGYAAAAAFIAATATGLSLWPQWARIAVPVLVYTVPLILGFVLRSALDDEDWWASAVRRLQKLIERSAPTGAAAFPARAAEVFRLAAAALAVLLALGALGIVISLLVRYGEVIALSQGLQLDAFGALMVFILQLIYLPTMWIWAVSWFVGTGFSVGAATSVSPFETLLGPIPALPLFGAIPEGWGWAGGFAPVIIVVIATALGGFVAGRPQMRRESTLAAAIIPVSAALLAGLVVALFSMLANGSIGPGRLGTSGPEAWQTGGILALELAFGMCLGVFARRVDISSLRDAVPASLTLLGGHKEAPPADGFEVQGEVSATVQPDRASVQHSGDLDETMPLEPLPPMREPEPELAPEAEPEQAPEPEPEEAIDPLLKAFSWDAEAPGSLPPETRQGLRSRMRSRWGRD